jgi:hypothetical protein
MAKACALATSLPDNSINITDCYIDDIPSICVDQGPNTELCVEAVTLAMYMFLPGPYPRTSPLHVTPSCHLPSCLAKEPCRILKVILGWKMDSHLLTIALSDEKYAYWTTDIEAMNKK